MYERGKKEKMGKRRNRFRGESMVIGKQGQEEEKNQRMVFNKGEEEKFEGIVRRSGIENSKRMKI